MRGATWPLARAMPRRNPSPRSLWSHRLRPAGQSADGAPDPVPIDAAMTTATTWSSGRGKHICAVLADGRALCTGLDNGGQLGDGPGDSSGRAHPRGRRSAQGTSQPKLVPAV